MSTSTTRSSDGDTVEFGDVRLEVIHLVGHTPGSIALLYDDPGGTPHLWTGDCLFPGGVGNTSGDKDDFNSLIEDVTTKVFDRLPDETWFYPGHGNDSVLGNERPHLAGVARTGLVRSFVSRILRHTLWSFGRPIRMTSRKTSYELVVRATSSYDVPGGGW